MKNKKAQMFHLPFGMIFSIILIIVFIVVAFVAIRHFLGIRDCSQIGLFKDDLQNEIDRAWHSDMTSEIFPPEDSTVTYLPSSILYVCFIDIDDEASGDNEDFYSEILKYLHENQNMVFYPPKKACEGLRSFEIKHINITEITAENNPYCVKNVNGKPSMKIEKEFYGSVKIK